MNVQQAVVATIGAISMGCALPVMADPAWLEKTVRVVVPWAPGGSTDIIGRLLAIELTARFKQQVVIDNRAGAGSIVGLQIATASPPDGYTFRMTSTGYGFLIDKPKVPVDLVNSFAPVAMIGYGDSALVVTPTFPIKTVKELIDLAKRRPGEILYASSGIGGFPHMNTELFKMMTGTSLTHIPFKGGGPATADVVAGHSQMQLGSLISVKAQVDANRLRLIAIGSEKRSPKYPDIPTIGETVPGYKSAIWFGIFVPPKTPGAIITRMNAELNDILSTSAMVKKLDEQGATIVKMTPAEFGKLMLEEQNKWLEVIRAAKIRAE